MTRSLREVFRYVVDPTGRVHYYADCFQLKGVTPREMTADEPERGLCWTCVERLATEAEAARR